MVMVVDPEENNTSDQRHIEYHLWEKYKVRMIRRSLTDIGNRATLDSTTKACTMYDQTFSAVSDC